MKCKQCGKELKQGAKFCVYCGARVDDADLGQTVTVAPVEPAVDPDATATVGPDMTVAVDPDMTMTVERREAVADSDTTTVVEPVDEPMGDAADEAASEPVDDGADESADEPVDMSAAFELSSEATTVLPDDSFTVAPTQQTVAMPKVSAPIDFSDANSSVSASADPKSPKSRRAAIGVGVAAAVVAVGAIGAFALKGLGANISADDSDSVTKSSSKAASQKHGVIKEKQIKTDLTAVGQLSKGFIPDSKFVDGGSYSLESLDVTSQKEDADGNVIVKATTVTSNDAFESTAKLTGTYTKKGKKYTPSWKVDSSTTKAIAPIEKDPSGLWTQGDIKFDKKAQTSTVKVNYEPLWFETVDGDVEYTYKFDGSKWVLDGDKAPKVSYENLVSDKYTDTSDEGHKALVEHFKITSADNGKIAFSFKWTQLFESFYSAVTPQMSTDVSGEATIIPVTMDSGKRFIICKTLIEKDSEVKGNKDAFAVSIMAEGPAEYDDASKQEVVVAVTGKMSKEDHDGLRSDFAATCGQTFNSRFEIPQEQSPTKE
ncbi:zinc ribbon domain-containing protein [Collinsella aerofaciens]|uniref:zinc ribbon domain-containing protein n=1 Tax=Collinsella aerofaciens TaxID=74426 RepID=UPI00321BE35D